MDYQLQVVDAHSDDDGGLPRAAERDLTIIFEYFAARGTGRAMGMSTKGVIMMESRNLMRLFRDAGMIDRPGRGPLTSARIDLIFTQVISDHVRRHADNSAHDAKHAKIGRDLPGLRGKGVQKEKKVVPRKLEFAQFLELLERCAGVMRRPFMSLVEEIVNSRGGHSAAHHMLGDSPASKGTPYTRRMSAAGKSLLAQHLETEHYVLDQEPQMQLGNGGGQQRQQQHQQVHQGHQGQQQRGGGPSSDGGRGRDYVPQETHQNSAPSPSSGAFTMRSRDNPNHQQHEKAAEAARERQQYQQYQQQHPSHHDMSQLYEEPPPPPTQLQEHLQQMQQQQQQKQQMQQQMQMQQKEPPFQGTAPAGRQADYSSLRAPPPPAAASQQPPPPMPLPPASSAHQGTGGTATRRQSWGVHNVSSNRARGEPLLANDLIEQMMRAPVGQSGDQESY